MTENYDLLVDIDNEWLSEWIARSGLSAAEHALIQPCYEMGGCPMPDSACVTVEFNPFYCSCTEVAIDCEDEDPCTVDSCDPDEGCIHEDTCNDGCRIAARARSSDSRWIGILPAALLAVYRRRSRKLRGNASR